MHRHPFVPSASKTLGALALLATLLGSAQAATVQFAVTDKDGKPAPDVVVVLHQPIKPVMRPPAAPVVIAQEGSRFVPFLSVVQVGSTVRFTNKDGYDHHVRSTPTGPLGSTPPAKSFELRLDAAAAAAGSNDPYGTPAPRKAAGTSSADLKMDQPGAIGLGCHIHGSMRGQLFVADSPWFGKTDANGIATLDSVPDGPAQVTLWHPDQLQDQATVPVQVDGAPLKAASQLNFVPRRRRG